jgi:crotonobetainyl-CoA:carnitine CoA-transferase CaiB-like acyl-CoA transferase
MIEKGLLPESFGPLQGVRIVSSGTLIAQPFAAELAAEMGAEVIQVERPDEGDIGWRRVGIRLEAVDGGPSVSTTWIQERRNMLCASLDLTKPKGRGLFLKLISHADIWMESSKAGTYDRWGLDDETVMKANPKLVITRVTGYGLHGDPSYLHRASYDFVGQAFGGMMYQTGFPEPAPPTRAVPWTGDYLAAYLAFGASLAALTYARSTGKGQVVDLAHYEAVHHTLGGTMVEYFQQKVVRERSGNRALAVQPYDSFEAKDGWVLIGAIGPAVFSRVCRVIGLDPNEEKWQRAHTELESIGGIEFDAILRGWVAERTVAEVERIFNEAQVASCAIMTSKDIAENPHYRARQVHVEWDDPQVGRVKGIGIIPKFSLTPGKVWRGSVRVGHDNARVYRDLVGLSDGEIDQLRDEGVI